MTDHVTAFRTRLPAGGPGWLIDYDRSVLDLFRRMMPGPFTLHGYDTANLPSASVHTHSVVYDHDADTIKFSDGANWLTYSLSTHTHAASAITNTPAGTIAATNVQAALNELDTEKLAASSYTAADVLAKLLTVDGAGSGLDADLLDGNSSAAFALAAHTHIIGDVTGLQAALDAKLDDSQATAAGLSVLGAADATAQRVLLRNGALVRKAADQTTADYTLGPVVTWDQESYDDNSWHDNSTNPSRMTVPSGVTRVRVGANLALSSVNASVRILVTILKNGTSVFDGAAAMEGATPGTAPRVSVSSGPIACVATDYFEVSLFVQTDTSITVVAANSNFWIEAC